ncbi:FtsB family cell division protein [Clostridiisalibacter paucivorans]|uniref:FtsB family cell division protein n=1 Tax=Clostridiisalibacter paucivorans TaxID=408753 RepID=UPI000687B2AF|nr:septum formation initiator family protein [Clostridiisalibacter paucivorans]
MSNDKGKTRLKIRHLLILFFVIYLLSTFIKQHRMITTLEAEKVQREEQVMELQQEIEEIKENVENSDSLEYIEKIAREELKMVKPEEIIFIDKNKYKEKETE